MLAQIRSREDGGAALGRALSKNHPKCSPGASRLPASHLALAPPARRATVTQAWRGTGRAPTPGLVWPSAFRPAARSSLSSLPRLPVPQPAPPSCPRIPVPPPRGALANIPPGPAPRPAQPEGRPVEPSVPLPQPARSRPRAPLPAPHTPAPHLLRFPHDPHGAPRWPRPLSAGPLRAPCGPPPSWLRSLAPLARPPHAAYPASLLPPRSRYSLATSPPAASPPRSRGPCQASAGGVTSPEPARMEAPLPGLLRCPGVWGDSMWGKSRLVIQPTASLGAPTDHPCLSLSLPCPVGRALLAPPPPPK